MYLTSFGWQTGSRQATTCRKGRKSLRVRYVRGERGCSKPVKYPIMSSLSVSFNQSIEAHYGGCVTFYTKPCASSEQVSMQHHPLPIYVTYGMIHRLANSTLYYRTLNPVVLQSKSPCRTTSQSTCLMA